MFPKILFLLALLAATSMALATTTSTGSAHSSLRGLEKQVLEVAVRKGRLPESSSELFKWLEDEKGDDLAKYIISDRWNQEIIYKVPPSGPNRLFDLYSSGANTIDEQGNGDDIVVWEFRDYYKSPSNYFGSLILYLVILDGPLLLLLIFIVRRKQVTV